MFLLTTLLTKLLFVLFLLHDILLLLSKIMCNVLSAGCLPNQEIQGKSGENQVNGLPLKNIRKISGKLASARDSQRNFRENICLCFFNHPIS